MKYISGILLVLNVSGVSAVDWNCRNHDMEISCDKEKCQISDDFTPLDVHIDHEGNMSIGMYSGVWEGKGRVLENQDYIVVIGDDLVFSTSTDMKEDFLISIDVRDEVAVIKGYGYAMPMRCERSEMENKMPDGD